MKSIERQNNESLLHGNLMSLGGNRKIAVYVRDGMAWVADFDDDRFGVFSASEWFSLNQGGRVLRHVALESIMPLPDDVAKRIESVHRRMTGGRDRPLNSWRVAAAFSELRSRLAKICNSLFGRPSSRSVDPTT